jgi:GDP-L-fucose synthase
MSDGLTPQSRIFVAGHRGMVGAALVRRLSEAGYSHLICRDRTQLNLIDQAQVAGFFAAEKPDVVFLAAAKVGGILANNDYPAEFIYDNLQIQNNVIHQAYLNGVKRLVFLGSSCIYPRECPQPMAEKHLLTGPLEPTNAPYAIAKIAGITLCESYNRQYGTDYLALMPTNLYGPGDNYDLVGSHVLPAMIRKFSDAKDRGDASVTLWGTGSPKREFLHVDDLADACLFAAENIHGGGGELPLINVGWGQDISIRELAEMVADEVGFTGDLVWDAEKPDGTPRKLLDTQKLTALGWTPKIGLRDGVRQGIEGFREEVADGSLRG